ncbi:hypothetical protein QZH41_000136 [Actinostola sp. cb2023]|nr:hypothetical protein QZH41_000136 [Actinostola sp. cb2023]
MVFRPISQSGVLMYAVQKPDARGKYDYIIILLRRGYVVFSYDLGKGSVVIQSSQQINLNNWNQLTVTRIGPAGTVNLNGAAVSGSAPKGLSNLNIDLGLYLGGVFGVVPRKLAKLMQTTGGFIGCIRKLVINNMIMDVRLQSPQRVQGFGPVAAKNQINGCINVKCMMLGCLNGARCGKENGKFVCKCPSGFMGDRCQLRYISILEYSWKILPRDVFPMVLLRAREQGRTGHMILTTIINTTIINTTIINIIIIIINTTIIINTIIINHHHQSPSFIIIIITVIINTTIINTTIINTTIINTTIINTTIIYHHHHHHQSSSTPPSSTPPSSSTINHHHLSSSSSPSSSTPPSSTPPSSTPPSSSLSSTAYYLRQSLSRSLNKRWRNATALEKQDTGLSVSFSGCIQDFIVDDPNLRSRSIDLSYPGNPSNEFFIKAPINVKKCGCRGYGCLNGGVCVKRTTDFRCESCGDIAVDVGIAIDGSGSVDNNEYRDVLDFVIDLIKVFKISPTAAHIGILEYGENATIRVKFSDYYDRNLLILRVNNLKQRTFEDTDITDGLRKAAELFDPAAGHGFALSLLAPLLEGLVPSEHSVKELKSWNGFNNQSEFILFELCLRQLILCLNGVTIGKINDCCKVDCSNSKSRICGEKVIISGNTFVDNYRKRQYKDPTNLLRELWTELERRFGNTAVITNALLRKLHLAAKFSEKDRDKLQAFADACADADSQLSNLPGLACLNFPNAINPITEKMPYFLQAKWERQVVDYAENNDDAYPGFHKFTMLIQRQAKLKNHPNVLATGVSSSKDNKLIKERRSYASPNPATTVRAYKSDAIPETKPESEDSITDKVCPFHEAKGHELTDCKAFGRKTLQAKTDWIRKAGLCFRCLSSKHQAKECNTTVTCEKCNSDRHQTILHLEKRKKEIGDNGEEVRTSCTGITNTKCVSESCSKIVLVDVYAEKQPQLSHRVYAVLDEQSNASMISPDLADILGQTSPKENYLLSTCSAVKELKQGRRVSGIIAKSMEGEPHRLPTLIECDYVPQNKKEIPTPQMVQRFPHLRNIACHIPPLDPKAKIQLLIGRDAPELLKVRDFSNGPRGAPWAQRLALGWTVSGTMCLNRMGGPVHLSVHTTKIDPPALSQPTDTQPVNQKETSGLKVTPCTNVFLVKESYNGEDLYRTTPDDNEASLSWEDRRFLDVVGKGIHKNAQGNWEMPLPFRSSNITMPNNRQQAASRLNNLLNSFKRKPQLEKDYFNFMAKVLERGHAVPIQSDEIETSMNNGRTWYLPHFGGYTTQRSRTKFVWFLMPLPSIKASR